MPFLDFTAGDVLTAANMDTTFRQGVMRFADAATRDTDLTGVLAEGLIVYLDDTNALHFYDGSGWEPILTSWTSFTPTWSGLSIGNGSQEAYYRYVGAQLQVHGNVTFGSSTGFSGVLSQTLPDSAAMPAAQTSTTSPFGQLTFLDDSGGTTVVGGVQYLASTSVVFKVWNAASTYLAAVNFSTTVPDAGAGDTSDVLSYAYTVPVS